MGPQELIERWLSQAEKFGFIAPIQSHGHFHNHQGLAFQATFIASGTAAAAGADYLMILDDDKDAHTTFGALCGADAIFEIYEEPTISATGTAYTPRNLNRTFAAEGNERGVHLTFAGPTVTDPGYLLSRIFVPGGSTQHAAGGKARPDFENIFRRGRSYLFRLWNWSDQNAEVVALDLEWYEEDFSAAIDGS